MEKIEGAIEDDGEVIEISEKLRKLHNNNNRSTK